MSLKKRCIYLCPKCREQVDLYNVPDGYFASCDKCDEAYYMHELDEDIKKEDAK